MLIDKITINHDGIQWFWVITTRGGLSRANSGSDSVIHCLVSLIEELRHLKIK